MGAWLPFAAHARKCAAVELFTRPFGERGRARSLASLPQRGRGNDSPSPGTLMRTGLSPKGRGDGHGRRAAEFVLTARLRPSLADHDNAEGDSLPKRERSAERRMSTIAAPSAAARFSRTRRARPSALTLAALATGYYPDGSAPEPGFPQTSLTGVLPARPSCLRLSTLRADRSFCRPTGDPGPPGSGSANPRAGTAPRSAFQACLPERRPR
jgi:hypothetical protein